MDILTSFCGVTHDHVCVTNYKLDVGSSELEYNEILESFHFDKIDGFAKVIAVNPLHANPQLFVLVVYCT